MDPEHAGDPPSAQVIAAASEIVMCVIMQSYPVLSHKCSKGCAWVLNTKYVEPVHRPAEHGYSCAGNTEARRPSGGE